MRAEVPQLLLLQILQRLLEIQPRVDRDRTSGSLSGAAGTRRSGNAARDTSERSRVDVHVRIAPLRKVQGVDNVGSNREHRAFAYLRSLGQPHVQHEVAWTLQIAQTERTDLA